MKTEAEIRTELFKVRELFARFREQGYEVDPMLWGAARALAWSMGHGKALSDVYVLLEDYLAGNLVERADEQSRKH